jgi:Uma2 family endonuclease
MASSIAKVTAEEYLALDRAAEFRSEFLDGEMVAMSGGSLRHSGLKVNLAAEVRASLRGKPFRAFDSDLRIRVTPQMYSYPDLTVACGKPLSADSRQDILLNPCYIRSPLAIHGILRSWREVPPLPGNRIAEGLHSGGSGSNSD